MPRKTNINCNFHFRRVLCFLIAALLWYLPIGALAAKTKDTRTQRALLAPSARKPIPKNPVFRRSPLPPAPSDVEISVYRLFEEPLSPNPRAQAAANENADLAIAINSFIRRTDSDDFSMLVNFLELHPNGKWSPALKLNLGLLNARLGFFSKAKELWQQAWNELKDNTDRGSYRLADRAIGELVQLNARMGNMDEVETELKEASGRTLYGSTEARLAAGQEALFRLKKDFRSVYKCGPAAVCSVYRALTGNHEPAMTAENFEATKNGVSLGQLNNLADKLGLKMRTAKRVPGAPIVFPAVMHWKLNHFSAVVGKSPEGKRYHVIDGTFGENGDFWIAKDAVDAESDGYFLIADQDLPNGWTAVSEDEASQIWGRLGGHARYEGPKTEWAPRIPLLCTRPGMASPAAYTMQGTLNIVDLPLSYDPPLGQTIDFAANYNDMEIAMQSTPTFSALGQNWTLNWVSWLEVDGDLGVPSGSIRVHPRGGGVEYFKNKSGTGNQPTFVPDFQSMAQLEPLPATNPVSYKRHMPDGSVEVYDLALNDTAGHILMTKVIDPQQHEINLSYDSNFRLTTITDAAGQQSSISYLSTNPTDPGFYLISSIQDPFQRTCSFSYDSASQRLVRITDVIGLQSSFIYEFNGFMTALTTPYGTTSFEQTTQNTPGALGGEARSLRVRFPDGTSSFLISYVKPDFLTAYWDRETLQRYPNDFDNADPSIRFSHSVNTHWLFDDSGTLVQTPFFNYIQRPLEAVTNFTYAGQSGGQINMSTNPLRVPNTISRTVVGGTQTYTFTHNSDGNITSVVDPILRKFQFNYRTPLVGEDPAVRLDLASITENKGTDNFILQKWTYPPNETLAHHLPSTYTDASGYTTNFQYNTDFQPTTITDPNNDQTVLSYTDKFLTSIDGPLAGNGDVTLLGYDGFNRLNSITDSLGYQQSFSFDAMNRLTKVTYPDPGQTSDEVIYERLDPVMMKDRIGRWTRQTFDNMQQLVAVTDPLGRTTKFEWCACGQLHSLTDPSGKTTSWDRDIEGRVVTKRYPDGKTISYDYASTYPANQTANGLVKIRTDSLSPAQTSTYSYNLDDTVSGISYTNSPSTSNVTMTYDPKFMRVATVANSWGTLTYSYNPYRADSDPPAVGSGRLASITNNVIANSAITFGYDNLGRTTNRSINGSANSTTWSYDAADRVLSETNPLGTFSFDYLGDSPPTVLKGSSLVSKITYPNNQTANFTYFPNTGDFRLQQMKNLTSGSSVLSQFDYQYNPAGEITQWIQQQNGVTKTQNFEYDKAGQLITMQETQPSITGYSEQRYYSYDQSANWTSESVFTGASNPSVSQGVFNNLNELMALKSGGPIRFQGTTSKAVKSAQVSTPVAVVLSSSAGTTYAVSKTPSNSTTNIVSMPLGDNAAVTIGGTVQADTILTLTATNPSLPGSPVSVSYTVKAEDALDSIATGVSAAVANSFALKDFGISSSNVAVADLATAKAFSANATLSTENGGNNSTAVSAIDGADHAKTDVYQVGVQSGPTSTFEYDFNGNMTRDGTTYYSWDAEDRLVKIAYGSPSSSDKTDLVYDGLGRCARIVESGTVSATQDFVWDSLDRVEDRSSVDRKFFALGQTIGGTSTVYDTDHLSSVREQVDSSNGTIDAQYSYTVFGERKKIAGTGPDADFGFAGMYVHARSGLNLTMFRAYNPALGRWLSRDPLGEAAGVNLYAYCFNDPINLVDMDGAAPNAPGLKISVIEGVGGGGLGQRAATAPVSGAASVGVSSGSGYTGSTFTVAPQAIPAQFAVTPGGTVLQIPSNSVVVPVISPTSGNAIGYSYAGGSLPRMGGGTFRADLRILNPTPTYPNGRACYSRNLPQGGHQNLDPQTGQTNNPRGLGTGGPHDVRGPHFGF